MTYGQLTIFLNEEDMSGDQPLSEVLVQTLLNLGIQGAAVFRGAMGYGRHHLIHRKRLFGMADDRPVLILAVDLEERLRAVIPEIRRFLPKGLITLQAVEILVED